MKLLIELDEEYVKVIDEIKFLVGGRTNRKLQLEVIKAIKNGIPLEQEPTTKNDLEVDLISRADAIKAMQDKAKKLKNEDTINGLCGAVAILFDMPSVTPQEQRKGHWINKQRLFDSCSAECSSCHKRSNGYLHDNGFSLASMYYDFCPKCGSDNSEVEE